MAYQSWPTKASRSFRATATTSNKDSILSEETGRPADLDGPSIWFRSRAQRANLAIAGDALIGLDRDHGRIEDRDGIAAGPAVGPFVQRQLDAIGADGGDFHG